MPGVAAQVNVVFVAETASYSVSLKAASKQLGVFETSAKGAGATARKEMAEARGAVAVLGEEIGVHLPRHVQKFVAGLPGVTSAMNAAFNSIAVLAIGAAVFEAGKKIYEFVEKNEEAARRNAAAWQDIARPMQQTNDELRLANDKIENMIAKLEHKPTNGMKEAIDEAIVSADTLGAKLAADSKKISETIEQHQVAWYERAVGDRGTGDISERAKSLQDNLDAIDVEGRNKLNALRAQGATDQQLANLTKELNAKRKAALDAEVIWANAELAAAKRIQEEKSRAGIPSAPRTALTPQQLMPDQTKRIGLLTNYAADIGRGSDFVGLTQEHAADLTHQKLSEAAANAEADAQKRMAEAIAKAMKTVEGRVKMLVGNRVKVPEAGLEAMRMEKEPVPGSLSNIALQIDEDTSMVHYGERWKGFNDAVTQGFEAQARFRSELMLTKLGLDESTGAVSRHEAAIKRLGIEDADYKSQASYIRDRMDQVRGDTTLTAPEQSQQVQQLQNQLDRVLADQKIRDIVGKNEIDSSSPFGQLRERAMDLAQQFTNLGDHLSNFATHTLESFNETLMRTLSTPANMLRGTHQWRQLGSGVAQQAGGAALQYAEGSFMKSVPGLEKLFGKKPTGASGDAFHVIVDRMVAAGALTDAPLSALGGMAGKVGGAVTAGLHLFHVPGFAEGGMIPSNMPALVGENGPELLPPVGHPRAVIPNGDFGMGGGGTIHIDARGASDPAMVIASVHRAMAGYLPQLAAGMPGAVRNYNSRVPSRSRI